MRRKRIRQSVSVLLSFLLLLSMTAIAGYAQPTVQAAEQTEEPAGVNYSVYGSQTLLESAEITYAMYMKWLEDHDNTGAYPNYYLGTPYVGYFVGTPFDGDDYRTPNGEAYAYGMRPPSYAPYNSHGMNCTGFVWNVLVNAGKRCGASQTALNSLPVVSGHLNYWANNDIYRYYFPGSNCIQDALNSGVLEKGDILWINGTEDWHAGIFYGDSPSDNKFWHSGAQHGLSSVNRISGIEPCGTAIEMYVLKAYHPARPPKIAQLAIKTVPKYTSVNGNGNYSLLGTKFRVFTSYADAQAAAADYGNTAAWSKNIGTIALDGNGFGVLRTGEVPLYAELESAGGAHEYFKRKPQAIDATKSYYAVEWGAGKNYVTDKTIYPLIDAKKSADSFWSDYNLVRTSAGLRFYVANTVNEYYAAALRVHAASEDTSLTDNNENYSLLGARFTVYGDYQDALDAAAAPVGSAERSKQTESYFGQILTNASGVGWLRIGEAPGEEVFATKEGQDGYFTSTIKPLLIGTYYAVQTGAGKGYEPSDEIYTFTSSNSAISMDGFEEIVFNAMKDNSLLILNKPVVTVPTTEPATEEPTTEQPATEPATEEPATEQPATEPATGEPATEQPATEPATEEPVTEQPATEPATGEPATEQPATEPATEEPVTEQPATEPATEEPATEQPSTEPVPTEEPKIYLCGDINNNGRVTINDATLLQRLLAEDDSRLPSDFSDTGLLTKVADVNGDGRVSIKDVTELQRYLADYEMKLDIINRPVKKGQPIPIDDPTVPREVAAIKEKE